jgi:hypothetical protein
MASSDSSSSTHSSSYVTEPRTVDDYFKNFKLALEEFYNTRNPHVGEYHLVGDYIVPTNKRKIVIYVAHGPLETARKISRIYYMLPVNPIYANMFDADADPDKTLPSDGPLFHIFDIPADHENATAFVVADIAGVPAASRLSPWTNEFTRLEAISASEEETFARRRGANKVVSYWTPMRRNIMETLRAVGIKLPGAAAAAAPAVEGAGSRTSSFGGTPGRSSTNTRRRRSAERRRRATRRKSTGDPNRLTEYYTDPATGKRMRRRRPNSDPKDD